MSAGISTLLTASHGFSSTHWMWPIITSRPTGVRSRRRRKGSGQSAEEAGHVPVLAHQPEAGALDPAAQPPHRHLLQQVVLLLLALLRPGR